MEPPHWQTEVVDVQRQVDGLRLQLTEIIVLSTKIVTSKTADVDVAPAPLKIAPLARIERVELSLNSTVPAPLLHSEYASKKLLSLVQFAHHGTKLFSDDRNWFTSNCIALYKWMRKITNAIGT